MHAAFYTEQGPASHVLRVDQQPKPEVQAGEVLVELSYSGVNPSDWKTRRGGLGRLLSFPLVIPHSDGMGRICAVGSGVAERRIGERVWLWNGQWRRPFGTAAEYIALPSEQAVAMPAGLADEAGACLGIPAMTAIAAVQKAELRSGSTVLVSGGAGAVAQYAIQFAKARGARVLTTVSSDEKAALAREVGADLTINYRTESVTAAVQAATDGQGVDAVLELELAANAKHLPGVIRPHGIVVVYGMDAAEIAMPALWLMQSTVTMKYFLVYDMLPPERDAALAEMRPLLEAGRLHHRIAQIFPLRDIVQAHETLERANAVGNVLLQIG